MTLETCRGGDLIVDCSILLPHSVPAPAQYCSGLPLQLDVVLFQTLICTSDVRRFVVPFQITYSNNSEDRNKLSEIRLSDKLQTPDLKCSEKSVRKNKFKIQKLKIHNYHLKLS